MNSTFLVFLPLVVGGIVVLAIITLMFERPDPSTKRNRILLSVGLVAISIGAGTWYYVTATQPVDDPSYFCSGPNPSPPTWVTASVVLQECADNQTMLLVGARPSPSP